MISKCKYIYFFLSEERKEVKEKQLQGKETVYQFKNQQWEKEQKKEDEYMIRNKA